MVTVTGLLSKSLAGIRTRATAYSIIIFANRDCRFFPILVQLTDRNSMGLCTRPKIPTFSDEFSDFALRANEGNMFAPLNIIQIGLISILTQEIAYTFYTNGIFYRERDPKSTLLVT